MRPLRVLCAPGRRKKDVNLTGQVGIWGRDEERNALCVSIPK